MKIWLANKFSVSVMPDSYKEFTVDIERVTKEEAKKVLSSALEVHPVIRYKGVANVFKTELGVVGEIPTVHSPSFKMENGDVLVLGRYIGPALRDTETAVPPGASVEWFIVTVKKPQ